MPLITAKSKIPPTHWPLSDNEIRQKVDKVDLGCSVFCVNIVYMDIKAGLKKILYFKGLEWSKNAH